MVIGEQKSTRFRSLCGLHVRKQLLSGELSFRSNYNNLVSILQRLFVVCCGVSVTRVHGYRPRSRRPSTDVGSMTPVEKKSSRCTGDQRFCILCRRDFVRRRRCWYGEINHQCVSPRIPVYARVFLPRVANGGALCIREALHGVTEVLEVDVHDA